MIVTSVSLPANMANVWREHREEILLLGQRYLRVLLRTNYLRRGVARKYNRKLPDRRIVTTRFSAAEYDALHLIASALRVSVSFIIYGMIIFWLKPSRRHSPFAYATNYWTEPGIWDPFAANLNENIQFFKMGENQGIESHKSRKNLTSRSLPPKIYRWIGRN